MVKKNIKMKDKLGPLPLSIMTYETNNHTAVINHRLGGPLLIGPCTVCNATPLVQVFCQKEGVSVLSVYTKAAGLPHFPTTDATWHDGSKDRRER